METLRRQALLLACIFGVAHPATADKKINVKINHAAVLPPALTARGAKIGRISGDCSREFADLLLRDMQARGVVTAAATQAAITISIEVQRCDAHPLSPILGTGLPALHISRTEGTFSAVVSVSDPSTEREVATLAVRGHAQKENQSQTTNPEYPPAAEVKSLALRQGLAEAQHLYAPWTENREIAFMDSKECHLKQAFDLAKDGDYEALLRVSRQNAESCGGAKAAEAWYNLGVACFLNRKYEEAIAAFEKASSVGGSKLVDGWIDESRKESAAVQAQAPKPEPPPATSTQTGILMTNDFIIKLVDGNVDEKEILKLIANQPGRFSFELADISRLKQAHVPESVISAMRNKKPAQ